MENKENYVGLPVEDGGVMAVYIALPENTNQPAPGLLLFQEAFGVNHHIRNVADRFAAGGYAVVAPELFHRTAPAGTEISYTDFPSAMPHMKALSKDGLEIDIKAAYKWLTENERVQKDKIHSIGYCLGGRVSFLANSILPLSAAVSYYGGGTNELASLSPNLHGKHLFYWGGKDQHIKQEDIDMVIKSLDDNGKPYINVRISDADHGFNCDERAAYNEKASKAAWAFTLAFFANN